jgi:DNA-binding PadR family transcriptional regulator
MTPVFGHGRLRLYLLKLLDESPRHGYDVIRELEDRFMGLYTPSAGTIYPRLARLETEGLVTHEVSEGRKVYRITDAGRAELAARQGELDDLEAEIAGSVRDFATEIRSEVRGSVQDLRQELKAAAKDMRRQARAEGRQARAEARSATSATRHDIAELTVLAEWARGELRNEAKRRMPTPEQVAEVRVILERALADVRQVLSGRQAGGSEGGSGSTGVEE